MNLEGIMLSEISQSQKANTLWFHLYENSKVVKFIETEKYSSGCQGLGGREKGGAVQWV